MLALCPSCTHENRPGSFFCSQCGTKLHFASAVTGALVRMNGSSQTRRFEIPGSVCVLGRDSDATLKFDEDSVSKQHARLSYTDGAFFIEDLGSANGTFVNGRRVRDCAEVRAGDLIRLGSVILKLEA